MSTLLFSLKSLCNIQPLAFAIGALCARYLPQKLSVEKFGKILSLIVLLCLGIKGGGALGCNKVFFKFFLLLVVSGMAVGFLQPFISFFILRFFNLVSTATAAAISACFGSISVMTFAIAVVFLDSFSIKYNPSIIAVCALMEIPAILSGLYLAKKYENTQSVPNVSWLSNIKHCFFDRNILALTFGILFGYICNVFSLAHILQPVISSWQVCVVVFLSIMGVRVGKKIKQQGFLNGKIVLFGIIMPLIGGMIGCVVSKILGLDLGTACLFTTLIASCSYIAVPAVMTTALPHAQENIYLSLSLAIVFPFNIIIGIPIYYSTLSALI